MIPITEWDIADALIRYGGSFAQGLGHLYRRADEANRRRLRHAFPELWDEYGQIVQKTRELHARIPERSRPS
jgi:hypothetical protein